jgi:hypothetical protein
MSIPMLKKPSHSLTVLCVIVAIFAAADLLYAQQPAPKTKMVSVAIDLDDGGKRRLVGGRLYKVSQASPEREHIADIDEKGVPSPSVECDKTEKFLAEPEIALVSGDKRPKFCSEKLAFSYRISKLISYDFSRAKQLASSGQFGTAHILFSNIYEASKTNDPIEANLAQEGAVTTAAIVMGDPNLEKFVVRDPMQDYLLVLSPRGVKQVKMIQVGANLPATGMLDFFTQKAIDEQATIKKDEIKANSKIRFKW